MKILRYRKDKLIKPGILDDNDNIRDLSGIIDDWNSSTMTIEQLNSLKNLDLNTLPKIDNIDSLAPPICQKTIGKFFRVSQF